jgi:predicted DNA-binding transcriptional regulator AlpA
MDRLDRRQLLALPAVIDVPTAAKALGLSRTAAYDLIKDDEWPTPVFRLGRLIRIPTTPILALLGIDTEHDDAQPPSTTRNAG